MDIDQQFVNSCTLTQWFPASEKNSIYRDNFIDCIEKSFDDGEHIIVIDGEEGIGKTTLLTQFAQKYCNDSFLMFIGSKCSWDYNAQIRIDDLCRQIHFYINKDVYLDNNTFEIFQLRDYFIKLIYNLKVYRKKVYILIDGLDQIPQEAKGNVDILLESIPLTNENIRILISTRSKSSDIISRIERVSKPNFIKLTGFSMLETKSFFKDIESLNDSDIETIYQSCKIPRRLSVIKDKIKSCSNIDECIKALTENLELFLEEEWHKNPANEIETKILSILTYDPITRNIEIIARILKIEVCKIMDIVKNSKYLSLEELKRDIWFSSEIYKSFFERILIDTSKYIRTMIIDYYVSNNDYTNPVVPSLMLSSGRLEDVLNYMSYDNMELILSDSCSYSTLISNIGYALRASESCSKAADSIKYSIAKNVVKDVGEVSVLLSEIDALFSLGKIDEAISFAQKAYTNEDRILLLSRVAKKLNNSGTTINPGIIDQIQELHIRIDYTQLKDRAVEIASEIIHFKPDLAIEIIEKTSGHNTVLENELDFAFARLSLERMSAKDSPENDDILNDIHSRISIKGLHNISKGLHFLLKGLDVSDLLSEINKLETISEKVLIIRKWLDINRKKTAALEVIDYAIQLISTSTEYKPSSDFYCDIVKPLPYLSSHIDAERLIKWFDNQQESIIKSSSIEDYVNIQIVICVTQSHHQMALLAERLINLYGYIYDIEDIVIKTECLSSLISKYDDINLDPQIEEKEKIYETITTDLSENVKKIALLTADHIKSFRQIIVNLSKRNFDLVEQVITCVNTLDRRNRCYYYSLDSYAEFTDKAQLSVKIIMNIINAIKDSALKGVAIYHVCEIFHKESKDVLPQPVWRAIFSSVKSIDDATLKTSILSNLIVMNDRYVEDTILWDNLLETWQAIDLHTDKIEIGYSVVSKLASKCQDRCLAFYKQIKVVESSIIFNTTSTFVNYILYLQNTIRAFAGLINKSIYNPDDYESIKGLILEIPSHCLRMRMWNDLALRFYSANHIDKGIQIVEKEMIPLLEAVDDRDKDSLNNVMTHAIVSFYKYDAIFALGKLTEMTDIRRNEGIINICNYIMYNVVPSDPIDNIKRFAKKLLYTEYICLLKLTNETTSDFSCYTIILALIDSMDPNRGNLSKNQISELSSKIEELINHKFPNQTCIKHDGFKIIALAQLNRINRNIDLKELFETAVNDIPNTADLVYVLAVLSELTPDTTFRKKILTRAEELINEIPSQYERLEHLELLGFHLWYKDKTASKKLFSKAIDLCKCSQYKDCMNTQKNIIEIVNRLDTEYAKSLIDIIDDDSSRKAARDSALDQKNQLKLKENLSKGNIVNEDFMSKNNYANLVDTTWNLLGQINAGGVTPIAYKNMTQYFEYIEDIGSYNLYPILAWMIENLIRKYSTTDSASMIIRPFFDNLLLGMKFMIHILQKANGMQIIENRASPKNDDRCIIIMPMERDKGISFVKSYLQSQEFKQVIICDKYFDPTCLDVIRMISQIQPNCEFKILTSRDTKNKFQKDEIEETIEETYKAYWRKNIAEDAIPCIDIVTVTIDNLFPSHDRYLITEQLVFQFGASIHGFGMTSSSQISIVDGQAAETIRKEMTQYAKMDRYANGKNVRYTQITI